MRILVFGRGVISTQYAWAFEKAGHSVTFYVRPGRKQEYDSTIELNLLDARKKIRGVNIKESWPVTLIEDFNANHDYDLIFVSVQHYRINKAVEFLSDKIGKATLLFFNNFWEEPLEQTKNLPANQLVWGFPQAGGGFDSKGVLNGTLFGAVYIGTFFNGQTQRGTAVMDWFKSAGFKIKELKDFRSWLFSHFVFNAALHLENLKSEAGMASLKNIRTTAYWKYVTLNGKELLPILKARNIDLHANSELKAFGMPPRLLSFIMNTIIKFLPSVKLIFTSHSNYSELQSFCRDVLLKAEELKINLPRYEKNKKLYI